MKIRTYFDRQLQQLQDDLIIFGSMVSEALLNSVKALRERDVVKAEQIIDYDRSLAVLTTIEEERFTGR